MNNATVKAALDARGYEVGASKVTASSQRMKKEVDQSADSMRRQKKVLDSMGGSFLTGSRGLASLVRGFTALYVVREITTVLIDFENAMGALAGVSGVSKTSATFQEFTDVARELGATTLFTASEAADGLLYLSRAGFTAEESMAAIPDTLDLAIAGLISLGQASDYASNILRQFNLEAAQTNKVADIMVHTANSTNTSVQQLANALKFVGPIAGALGESLEDTAAALGQLGNAGIQAAFAGTGLRGLYSSLLGPTKEALDTFAEMGLTMDDVSVQTHGLIQVMENLGDAGLTADQAITIFNRRQASSALILSGSTREAKALSDEYGRMGGIARENAAKLEDTIGGSFRFLLAATQELILSIGESGLTAVIRGIVDSLTSMMRHLTGSAEATDRMNKVGSMLADVLKIAAGAAGLFVASQIVSYIAGLSAVLPAATSALMAFNAAAIANPFLFAVAPFAAVIAGIAMVGYEVSNAKKEVHGFNDSFRATVALIERFQSSGITKTRLIQEGKITEALREQLIQVRSIEAQLDKVLAKPQTTASYGSLADILPFFENQDSIFEKVLGDKNPQGLENLNRFNEQVAKMTKLVESGEMPRKQLEDFVNGVDWSHMDYALYGSGSAQDIRLDREDMIALLTEERDRLQGVVDIAPQAAAAYDALAATFNAVKAGLTTPSKKGGLREYTEEQEEAFAAMAALVEQRKHETTLIGKEGAELEFLQEMRKLELIAMKAKVGVNPLIITALYAEIQLQHELTSKLERQAEIWKNNEQGVEDFHSTVQTAGASMVTIWGKVTEAIDQVVEAQQNLSTSMVKVHQDLKFEQTLVGATNDQREKAVLMRQMEALALQDKTGKLQTMLPLIEKELDRLHKLEAVNKLADGLAGAFTDALSSVLTNVKSIEEAVHNLGLALIQVALQALALDPLKEVLKSGISGLMSSSAATAPPPSAGATGKAYFGGAEMAFAGGGFFSGPSHFPLTNHAGGGLAGEQGGEVLMPAVRKNGKVMVSASGGGGDNIVNVHVHGVTDAASFKKSSRQIKADMQRGLGK